MDEREAAVHEAIGALALEGKPHAKSAARVLDLIEALSRAPDGVRFTELHGMVAIPKSSLHELLTVLTDRGYASFDRDRRTYALGIRAWEAGQAYLRHRDLEREARPVMEEIVGQINETVQLAVLDGVDNVYLAKVDCSHPIRLQSEVGKRLPAHATGLGKVLLAHLPDEELTRRLRGGALARFTPATIADVARLWPELVATRQRGFAVDDQEYTPGLRCVAVPVHDHRGEVVAALSVSIPIMRAEPQRLAAALRAIAAGSLAIARRLGGAEDDPRLERLGGATAEVVAAALSKEGPRRREEVAAPGGGVDGTSVAVRR